MYGISVANIAVVTTVVTLLYASYWDLRIREVPELTWIPAYLVATLSILLRYLSGSLTLNTVSLVLALIPSIAYAALFIAKLMGGADLLAMLLVCLIHIDDPIIPLLTYILSSVAPIPLIAVNLLMNILVRSDVMKKVRCVSGSKKVLYLVGKPIRVAEFLNKKFVFLHTYPLGEGFICSSSVDVDVDFEEQRLRMVSALSNGLVKLEDYVVCSPALPHVVFICFSYIASLLAIPYLRSLIPPLF